MKKLGVQVDTGATVETGAQAQAGAEVRASAKAMAGPTGCRWTFNIKSPLCNWKDFYW